MVNEPAPSLVEDGDEGYQPVMSVTPRARSVVLDARSNEPDPDRLALWVEVTGSRGGAYAYDIYFEPLADAAPDDTIQHDDDLPVVIPRRSVERLKGARLDFSDDGPDGGGLMILNPNTPPRPDSLANRPAGGVLPEGVEADLSGEIARMVLAVLDESVNPSIASHGGRADLVAVDESEGIAYLRLSGGCQGCGMARVTLSQGIEVAIRDAVPAVTAVVDVTDHADGTNPYYEPAKK
ncbi:MAG: NifU family protein [Acidimicrobiales bacterium]